MVTTKRGGDLTTSSHKNERACNAGEGTNESLISGGTVLFACSGIAIQRQGYVTWFLTSASLVRAFNDGKKVHGSIKIEVRHEGSEVYRGFLAEYNLDHNFAAVYIMTFLDVHVVLLKRAEEILPHSNVVAVGRDISGKVITRSVILTGDLSGSEDSKELMLSTCYSEAWEGGPLFHFDGNFVGMNVSLVMERTVFLPWRIFIERLELVWTSRQKKKFFPDLKFLKAVRLGERPTGDISNCHPEGDISNCHPEEPFGDVFGQGVWRGLSKQVSSNIQRNVVALASFNGETRFFACTGFFIEWNGSTTILTSASLVRSSGNNNKIEENLRIEVYTNGRRREGTLQHYSLHYNVALVSVKDYRPLRPANIQLQYYMCSELAAVGRCFKSGTLMAANGLLVDWTGTLDCKFLVRSSCKISKAGIGGPLVDFDGKVIGMNFYDKKIGTPFLLWKTIHKILAHFKETKKSTVAEPGNDSDPSGVPYWKMAGDPSVRPNRWPVSMPYRRRRDDLSEDESELPSGLVGRYTYRNGKRYLYKSHRPLALLS
ncbi:uncharacterized protein LOC133891149 isoform X2 [Phragmites australis]|uniref:uncharacterized protein LOC133891149 isoform X2 n=1 Tax=Phragmites australis TaxID=29695 RepID=UPI002D79D13A|nr:uncharacterized protein LOC133891149 isoform X2 [Phragmites australis]